MKRKTCMNCGSSDIVEFLDLGDQPNGNAFLFADQLSDEPYYSMKMDVCRSCWQVQIDEFPSQSVLFDDHPYVSGVNVPVVEHFEKMAKRSANDLNLQRGDLVLDIGCNDGSLLSAYRKCGATTIGIDPGKRVVELARENGHLACRAFWNSASARSMHELGITPKIISGTAVFYHVPDLHDFIDGLDILMNDETVFVVQGVSLVDVITKNQFDHFYHEHSCIHSIFALQRLFAQHQMKIFDVFEYDIHGGSFVAYVAKNSANREVSDRVDAYVAKELSHGLDNIETYHAFSARVEKNTKDLRTLLENLKAEGKSVFGLGAPLKGSTMLNYGDIGPDLVPCLTEVNEFKIGRLSPGTHIPVVDERTLEREPDYYLVLAWNFLDFFLERKADYLRGGGKFIVSVPELRILDASDLRIRGGAA
ncbi:MAG: class I SAM-dependent methyltransferase [Pseudomonadota bacterium]